MGWFYSLFDGAQHDLERGKGDAALKREESVTRVLWLSSRTGGKPKRFWRVNNFNFSRLPPPSLVTRTRTDIITLWLEIRKHFEFISLYSSQKLLIIMSNFLEIQLKCERNILEMSYNWISWEFQLLHSKEKDFQHHPPNCWWRRHTHTLSLCLPFHWVRNGK